MGYKITNTKIEMANVRVEMTNERPETKTETRGSEYAKYIEEFVKSDKKFMKFTFTPTENISIYDIRNNIYSYINRTEYRGKIGVHGRSREKFIYLEKI